MPSRECRHCIFACLGDFLALVLDLPHLQDLQLFLCQTCLCAFNALHCFILAECTGGMHRLNIRLDNKTIRVSLNLKARIVTFAEYLTCGRIHKCENLLLKWSSNVITNARTLIFGGFGCKAGLAEACGTRAGRRRGRTQHCAWRSEHRGGAQGAAAAAASTALLLPRPQGRHRPACRGENTPVTDQHCVSHGGRMNCI
jgi:hypothetical protein